MKKILTVSVLLFGMLAQSSFAGETQSYSFGEWVEMAAAKTGYKMVCPPELLELANQRGIKLGKSPSYMSVTPEEWKKFFACYFMINCTEDSQNRTLTLDVGWKTYNYFASSAKLLEHLLHSNRELEMVFGSTAETLNALLTVDCNYARAWKVRQMSFMSQILLEAVSPPRLVGKLVSRSGREYVLVITVQEIQVMPGSGSMAWYLFDRDGVLMSADLVNTGHDIGFGSASIGDGELRIVLDRWYVTYAAEDDQLKLARATYFDGKNVKVIEDAGAIMSQGIGKSLMPK